jgi:glycerol-3-phosphate acyltransferase PlsX
MLKPIAIDAMGGDHAPECIVSGAAQAAHRFHLPLLLVGDERALRQELDRYPHRRDSLEIVHAPDCIGMEESPAVALRRKPAASVLVAFDLVQSGRASAVVSAGNSGAAMGGALLKLGPVSGIERPAIASIVPARQGHMILLDVGATVDCKPQNLLDFARMGAVYAREVLGLAQPRVGILSIGAEPGKGNALTKGTHQLLSESDLHFVGNVEGNDLLKGVADVVVCDGFVGNVALKVGEAFAELFTQTLRRELTRSRRYALGRLLLASALKRFRRVLDYSEYGGALLLGVNGVCVISHGRSDGKAVVSAIRLAADSVEHAVVERIAASFQSPTPPPLQGVLHESS